MGMLSLLQKFDGQSSRNPIKASSSLSLETSFILISLSFGILFLVTTPPFQVADESRHFARAYQLSEVALSSLKLIPTQDFLPESLVSAIKQTEYLRSQSGPKATHEQIAVLMQIKLNPTKRAAYDELASYTFISYLPQIFATIPLRLAEVNAVVTLYVARLVALLFWTTMTYWAIRIIPVAKHLFFFIVLLPMTIFQAGSTSADSVTFALSFLLTALYLRLAYQSAPVKRKELLVIGVMSAMLTAAKFVYVPLIGLHFLIPSSKFRSSAHYIGSFLLVSCLCLLVLLAPFNSLFSQAATTLDQSGSMVTNTGLTPYPQLNFLLASPQNIIKTAFATFVRFGRSYMNGFVGILGWYGASLPSYLEVVTVIALWLTAFITANEFYISLKNKLLLTLIICVIIGAICLGIATDVRENPVPTVQMRGIQGRYFTPFALLIGLLASNQAALFRPYQHLVKRLIIPFILFVLTNAYYSLLVRYYF